MKIKNYFTFQGVPNVTPDTIENYIEVVCKVEVVKIWTFYAYLGMVVAQVDPPVQEKGQFHKTWAKSPKQCGAHFA